MIGRAGTGKTETCLRESLAALHAGGPQGPALVILAPEQATFQWERALLERLPPGEALVRLQVLSFQRLAWAVLAEVGDGGRPRLSAAGRRMALRTVLRDIRSALNTFGASADRAGFAQGIAEQIAEFEAYGLSPQALRAVSERLPLATALRTRDLATVWEAYRRHIAATGVWDPGSDLAAAAQALPESSLRGAVCWVDGFAGFTPREEGVLEAWLRGGADIRVALCLDAAIAAGPSRPFHPFAATRHTLRRLSAVGERVGIAAPEIVVLPADHPYRFRHSPDLAHLEAYLWEAAAGPGTAVQSSAQQGTTSEPGSSGLAPQARATAAVRVLAAASARVEAEACASEIDRLCRTEGFRYREVAVITRDLDTYHDLLALAFARRNIPAFIDRKRPATRHPVAQALLAALEILTAGWTTAAVRQYLQCDLCSLRRHQADALDNHAVATGLSGDGWYRARLGSAPRSGSGETPAAIAFGAGGSRASPPHAAPGAGAADPRLDRWRLRVVAPVRRLESVWQAPAATAETVALACYRLLLELRAPERVGAWIAEAEAAGDLALAAWHRQCWDAVLGLLDQVVLALKGSPLDAPGLLAALQSGLEPLTVGLVPPGLDQVLCGAIDRSRHPEVRVAFVLGMGEGLFPPPPNENTLLPDADRLTLRAVGVELAPTAEERLLHEEYLAYIAVTRASERLYISYPAGVGPADPVKRIQRLVATTNWGDDIGPTARAGIIALAGEVAQRLREGQGDAPKPAGAGWTVSPVCPVSPVSTQALAAPRLAGGDPWVEAAAWLQADAERAKQAGPILAALQPPQRPHLPPSLATRLYPASFSPTRLEAMGTCPFQHFARHGLRLRERPEARVDAGQLGTLLHAALCAFVAGLLREGLDWAELEPADAEQRAARALSGVAGIVFSQVPQGSARAEHLVSAAGRDLRRSVHTMLTQARAGSYRPIAVERPLTGVLSGRIDRLDEAVDAAGTIHRRIIDYKTGSARFSLSAFVDRVDLAPVLYLAQALADGHPASATSQGAVPGGFFLFPVRDPLRLVSGPEAAENATPHLQGLAPAENQARALHESALDGSVTGVRVNRDGSLRKGAPAACRARFDLLLRAAMRRVTWLRAEAAEGRVTPHPYRSGEDMACTRCELLAACRFDPAQGDRYRWATGGEPWARLVGEEQEAQDAPVAAREGTPGGAEASGRSGPVGPLGSSGAASRPATPGQRGNSR